MKCPNCGSEIRDGYLYCEKCGEEIRIVPDFDATLDENIQVNLSNVFDELNSEFATKELTKDISEVKKIKNQINSIDTDINIDGSLSKKNSDNKDNKHTNKVIYIVISVIVAIIIIGVISLVILKLNEFYSYDTQYEEAFELYDSGNYEESIKKVKHVISLDDSEERPKLLLCDNYYEVGKYDEALAVLETLMDKYPNDMNIYERLVKNYDAKNDIESISKLISSTEDESVKYMYGDYIRPTLDMSPESGTYEKTQYITLTSLPNSDIYYSVDGSDPNESTLRYTEPIEVESGEVTIKAVSINKKGIRSDIVEGSFIIDFEIPDAPNVITGSGNYMTPTLIEVKVPEGFECYYTIDNAEPTREATKYTGPFAMHIGEHKYKFACIDSKGLSSDVITCTFKLDIVNLVDMGTAKNGLLLTLTNLGKNIDGLTYKCEQACLFNGNTYYIINEYSQQKVESDDLNEADYIDKKTGNIYAVDVLTGMIFKAMLDEKSGQYSLTAVN